MSKDYSIIPSAIFNWPAVRSLHLTHKITYIKIFAAIGSNSGSFYFDFEIEAPLLGVDANTFPNILENLVQNDLILWDRRTGEVFAKKYISHQKLTEIRLQILQNSLDLINSHIIKREIIKQIKYLANKSNQIKLSKVKSKQKQESSDDDSKKNDFDSFSEQEKTFINKQAKVFSVAEDVVQTLLLELKNAGKKNPEGYALTLMRQGKFSFLQTENPPIQSSGSGGRALKKGETTTLKVVQFKPSQPTQAFKKFCGGAKNA